MPGPDSVTLPRPPEPSSRQPFPVLASIAPVVGSLVIWAITASPFALVFAGLGPIIAIATMADSRWQGRRALRLDSARFAAELDDARAAIAHAHARELADRTARTPPALAMLDSPVHDPERWRSSLNAELPLSLGIGAVPSGLRLDGAGSSELDEVVRSAATLAAPVVIDARLGIGIVGAAVPATAIARGLALQVASRLPPETATCRGTAVEGEWLRALPHSVAVDADGADAERAQPGGGQISWSDEFGAVIIAHARTVGALPRECRVIVVAGREGESRVMSHPDPALCIAFEPERVSVAQAAEVAARLALGASGRRSSAGRLPDAVEWSSLDQTADGGDNRALGATFMVGAGGPLVLDLVGHGPHAVVAGTTGSGKSELLVSWLLAIAAAHSPSDVTFLLVDFKGGASFGPVAGLPHVVGLVTDLDERTAHRALVSLRAEVLLRERALAAAGVRSIDELRGAGHIPRLLIVVDEFAALVSGFDELHGLFSDLAARGRSLGVHLVLSTQRPAGVVRDSVLANVPLRISLRVHNRADSIALLGTDAAALLPADPAGRAVVVLPGGEQSTVQITLATESDSRTVSARWSNSEPPRRPWRDDLPEVVPIEGLESTPGRVFGLLDLPADQRQATASWQPASDGNLLVLGMSGSGKTAALAAIAHAGDVSRVPSAMEPAWDVIVGAVEGIRSGSAKSGVLLIDDLDALLPRFGDDHQQAFVELLVELLRTGAAAGVHVAITARRLTAPLQQVAQLCDARLVLRQQSRQEHLLAGGDSSLFASSAPAGRGDWRGAAVQVAVAPPMLERSDESDAAFDPTHWPAILVVTRRPAYYVERWGAAELDPLEIRDPGIPSVLVGDADSWHANWSRLAALRRTSAMLFDGCTIADFRSLSGTRQLPPPIERPGTRGWLLEPTGSVRRVAL
jgi:S-DNA-T family DNA segregation ATPase FtsK/SpoIIIE